MTAAPAHSQLSRDPRFLFGAGVLAAGALAGLLAPWIAPYDPNIALGRDTLSLVAPRAGHWLGTDIQSRDLLSRMLYGARASLGTAGARRRASRPRSALVWDWPRGASAGWRDSALMRFADFSWQYPGS